MKIAPGSVKQVVRLASHIAELRAEAQALSERIAEEEAALGELVRGGRPRRGRKAAVVAKGPRRRGAAAGGTIMDAIIATLKGRSGQAFSVGQVADAVGAKPSSVATMLKRLVDRGYAHKPATGRYQAA
jgi:hypothetical protein